MKNLIKSFLIITIGTFLPYLVGSFCCVSFNIANWSEEDRSMVGITMFFFFLISAFIASDVKDSDNQYNEPISKKTRMKKLIKKFLIITVLTSMPYLVGSFCCVSFNIANWSEEDRVVVGITMLVLFLISVVIAISEEESDNQYNEPISKKTLNGFSKYQDDSRVVSLEDYKNK